MSEEMFFKNILMVKDVAVFIETNLTVFFFQPYVSDVMSCDNKKVLTDGKSELRGDGRTELRPGLQPTIQCLCQSCQWN